MSAAAKIEDITEEKITQFFENAAKVKEENPGNRCAKHLISKEAFMELTPDLQLTFYRCVCTGIDNPDSGLGCYAMTPSDYDTFKDFFNKVIGDYHKNNPECDDTHITDWDIGDSDYNLKNLGLENELSMRVRVGRNIEGFNLPGLMDQAERIKFEVAMLKSFEAVKEKFGGEVYSMSPDHGTDPDGNKIENPNLITDEKYNELVNAHVMFKDMDADPYLKSAGISSDWPYGRGCWQSEAKDKIIWFGEEDQLRIMCMKKGFDMSEVFTGLNELLTCVESIEGISFAKHERFGYVTSCPSNLGTGMRASVHIQLPNLTSDGTDKAVKEIAGPLGLSVRGTGGEHTPIGADGTVDISPRARLFIKENEIVGKLLEGLKSLLEAEKAAAAPAGDTAPADAPAGDAAAAEAPAEEAPAASE